VLFECGTGRQEDGASAQTGAVVETYLRDEIETGSALCVVLCVLCVLCSVCCVLCCVCCVLCCVVCRVMSCCVVLCCEKRKPIIGKNKQRQRILTALRFILIALQAFQLSIFCFLNFTSFSLSFRRRRNGFFARCVDQ